MQPSQPRDPTSPLEKFMFRSVPVWAVLLLALFGTLAAVAFGALAISGARDGEKSALLPGLAASIAGFPAYVVNMPARSVDPFLAPNGRPDDSPGFWSSPDMTDEEYLLLTRYDGAVRRPYLSLMRLPDGLEVKRWDPDLGALQATALEAATPATSMPGVPFAPGYATLLPDGGLLFVANHLLVRVDVCGRTVWTRSGPHHSIERTSQGVVWTPSTARRASRPLSAPTYRDDMVMAFDPDGGVLHEARLSDVFAASGLAPLVEGRPYTDDPYHLNDVQPVEFDGPHWRAGDVFLSLRHLSMVALYRPSQRKIIWWRIGPWLAQHDVQILDEHRFAVFDNRTALDDGVRRPVGVSRELVYDFRTDSVTSPWQEAFETHDIRVLSGGRGQVMQDGDLVVEDTVHGVMWRLSPEGVVRWRWVNVDAIGRRYRLFWGQSLNRVVVEPALAAFERSNCS